MSKDGKELLNQFWDRACNEKHRQEEFIFRLWNNAQREYWRRWKLGDSNESQ